MHFNNLPREPNCIQCIETVPFCDICAPDEQCVVTSQTCTACASATCVPAPTTASSYQLVARDAEKTEIAVTLTDSNGTPTATSTIFSKSGSTSSTPAFAYGVIAGGIIILAILGTFFYCTCYKRRARGKLPGYQSFGSESALSTSAEGGNVREVKGQE